MIWLAMLAATTAGVVRSMATVALPSVALTGNAVPAAEALTVRSTALETLPAVAVTYGLAMAEIRSVATVRLLSPSTAASVWEKIVPSMVMEWTVPFPSAKN